MASAGALLNKRRFLPLFVTQLLGAFNDNLYKNAMVLFVVYSVYNDETAETWFSAIATAIFILPFFLLSALAGQLADTRDKAAIIRIVKFCEIIIMLVGGTGLYMAWAGTAVHTVAIPLMMLALFAMGIHSTFFGPIKYAILPQHLNDEEVLGGTGLVEAGTYIAILLGTILAGWIPVEVAGVAVVLTAIIGYFTGRQVPPAPPMTEATKLDFNFIRASIALIKATTRVRRVFLAIVAISFFWTIGSVLIIVFPPLVKNVLTADERVASGAIAVFSVGVAIGSVVINTMLKGKISARYSPVSVIAMGVFVVIFSLLCRTWVPAAPGHYYDWSQFVAQPRAIPIMLCLLAIATTGGMFVVPLYAFLTTTVEKDQTARTVAANNVVNSGAMTFGSIAVLGINMLGVTPVDMLFLVAAMCLVSAWIAQKLHLACD